MDTNNIGTNNGSSQTVICEVGKLQNDATCISMETLETNAQPTRTSRRNSSTTLALTKDLALMFDRPDELKIAVTEDFTEMFETGKGVKQLSTMYKRFLMQSLDSFDEDDSSFTGQRFVTKKGFIRVNYLNMPGLKRKLTMDLFHTIMDAKWRYFILLFFLSFLMTWLLFAGIWYAIFFLRNGMVCVKNVNSFTTAFLFSIETQVTIGYGGRSVTEKCPEGVIVMIIQIVIGNFVNTVLLGVLFAKLARPKNRGKTVVFSKQAVITLRDGKYCLIFRYVDLRDRKLLDSNMRLIIIKPHLTKEGEYIPFNMMDMNLTIDHGQVDYSLRLFPIYPVSIIHIIDETSPLYTLSKKDLGTTDFELIAILEGTVPGTGNATEAVMSYKPSEVLWGHRFKPMFRERRPGTAANCIDLRDLNIIQKEDITPDCSAMEAMEDDHCDGSSSISSSTERHPSFYVTNLASKL